MRWNLRIRGLAFWIGMVLAGIALGLGSAVLVLGVGSEEGVFSSGPWKTSLRTGSIKADWYTRTRIALFGLLALDKREALYYRATTDAEGADLRGNCDYEIKGGELAARWWSITAYDSRGYLMANAANVYSVSKTTVVREQEGQYTIRVSAHRQEVNWLPVKAGERFDLTARFYNPEASVLAAPESTPLPHIQRERCR